MSEENKRSTNIAEGIGIGIEPIEGRDRLPAVIESVQPQTQQRSKSRLALLVVVLILGASVGIGWLFLPSWLATLAQASPSTHFVSFAQAILYRGAGFAVVWPQFVTVALIGGIFLGLALLRFRKISGAPM